MKTEITAVRARQIWDSRGRPTVEAEVALKGGVVGRASAPAGASRGIHEAVDLRDGGHRFGGMGVSRAVEAVNERLGPALVGQNVADQAGVDERIIEVDGTADKSGCGGNATVAVSMAALHAAAAAKAMPLWKWLAGGRKVRLPMPEIQIFGGGAHAARRSDVQDFMIMAPGADSVREALEITAEVYRAAGRIMEDRNLLAGTADEGGWWPNFRSNEEALEMLVEAIEGAGYQPGEQVHISLDIASSEFFRDGLYRLPLDGAELDSDGMIDLLAGWTAKFPILSIEDPAGQEDEKGMVLATARLGEKVQIIGDDYLVTSADRVREASGKGACNALLVKVNQAGTVTEAELAMKEARSRGWGCIVSARSGETEDVTIAHLATGWDCGQIKVGSFARSERMAKWNELLRIEEALGPDAEFAGGNALPGPVGRRFER